MNYGQFLYMVPEATLMAILVVAFIADFISSKHAERKWFNPLMCLLMLGQVVVSFLQTDTVQAFGGMYRAVPAAHVIKTILAAGTLIVMIQARQWLRRPDTSFKEGEFYMLVVSTLLGMNMMVSAGHFLMFFLGLEMASVPMACLVALDKYVMLYGISFLYGAFGTLYFTSMAISTAFTEHTALVVLGLVFFFSGLGFKISLVPFHFWTADTYQGAPTTVTGYLSVVSKGAAAFALCIILMRVFAPVVEQWQYLLYIVIVLSITVANLFAIRQSELKRFMAFSSISQAGYIMLAVIGNSVTGIAALSYYVLVYVVANLAVFTVIGVVEENNGGRTDMEAYNGFYQTNPKLSFLMTVALFSLAGIPPFAGMFSKFFVFMAAAEQGSFMAYFVVFIALVNTVVSLYYYLLIVKAMYIKQTDSPLPTFKSDLNTKVALALCTAGIILFGVCSYFYNWIYTTL